jgi:hypothetical protein
MVVSSALRAICRGSLVQHRGGDDQDLAQHHLRRLGPASLRTAETRSRTIGARLSGARLSSWRSSSVQAKAGIGGRLGNGRPVADRRRRRLADLQRLLDQQGQAMVPARLVTLVVVGYARSCSLSKSASGCRDGRGRRRLGATVQLSRCGIQSHSRRRPSASRGVGGLLVGGQHPRRGPPAVDAQLAAGALDQGVGPRLGNPHQRADLFGQPMLADPAQGLALALGQQLDIGRRGRIEGLSMRRLIQRSVGKAPDAPL